MKLEEYKYEVVYKKGSNNTNVDALRRMHVAEGCGDNHDDKSGLTGKTSNFSGNA
jgi:hypothetical protein